MRYVTTAFSRSRLERAWFWRMDTVYEKGIRGGGEEMLEN